LFANKLSKNWEFISKAIVVYWVGGESLIYTIKNFKEKKEKNSPLN